MKFYHTTNNLLIQFNPETKVARIKNNIGLEKSILSEEEFNYLEKTKLNKNKFNELLNKYFKETKHSWVYDNTPFRRLDYFENKGSSYMGNYNWKDIPKHNIGDGYMEDKCFIVYNQGRLFYTFIQGNYFPQMQLIDIATKKLTSKWTNIRNCAPVFNEKTKQII